jgi:predicted component of type VI protein secretion system
MSARRASALLGLAALVAGCASEPGASGGPPPKPVKLLLRADPHCNGDRAVHVLVRAVTEAEHATESYAQAVARCGDPSLLDELALLPGDEVHVGPFPGFGVKGLGVYVLLADPGANEERRWKRFWPARALSVTPDELVVELGPSEIVAAGAP